MDLLIPVLFLGVIVCVLMVIVYVLMIMLD